MPILAGMNGIDKAIAICGSNAALARKLNISAEAVRKWSVEGCPPPDRVLQIYAVIDGVVSPHDLNARIYPDPAWRPDQAALTAIMAGTVDSAGNCHAD